jgi:hypothetical protein
MRRGDWLVYYSPRTSLRDGEPLQAFTAIGEVADDDIWQADQGGFTPWRRRIAYIDGTADVGVRALAAKLKLTSAPNWGSQLRRGLIELSPGDFAVIRSAMTASG